MLRVVENDDELEITAPMPPVTRVIYLLLALLPLIAPYELLLVPDWETIFHPFFALAAVVSFGALAMTVFLAWTAVAGIEASARFLRHRRTLTTTERAPIMPRRTRTRSLDDLRAIEVEKTEWSDGGPSYALRIETADGQAFRLLASYEKGAVEEVRRQIGRFLSVPQPDAARTEDPGCA